MAQAATALTSLSTSESLPREARNYAIRELIRRAGVSAATIQTWRIEFEGSRWVNVFVQPGTEARLRFPLAPDLHWERLRAGQFHTSTASWLRDPAKSVAELIPNFKVPFSSSDRDHVGALFFATSSTCVECAVDLPSSALLTLSRFEETLPVPRDEHGRFEAASSIAWRDGFLDRPIVDEYGLAFADAISYLMPRWEPETRKLRVKLGHDVDEIGLPFNFHSAAAHALKRYSPVAAIRDLLAPATGISTTYQKFLRDIVLLATEADLDATVYWKCSAKGAHDTGYDPRHPRVRAQIEELRQQGIAMGIHPGYQTFDSLETFAAEVDAVTAILGERRVGGRQDFLRWKPATWIDWDAAGLAYDASVGFADCVGFRAGTAVPFHPWILSENREANLLEIPIVAMDSTLQGYMKRNADEALGELRELVKRCRLVGGVFHLVWHNTKMMDPGYTRTYRTLLGELAGSAAYDWRAWDDDGD
jgi:hypothetical protein